MGGGVHHCPESHRVGDLSMEPNVLVGGEEPGNLGTDDADDVAQHGEEDKATIEGKNETSAARRPDRKTESVEASKLRVGCLQTKIRAELEEKEHTDLTVPAIGKQTKVCAVEKNIESEPTGNEELAVEPAFAHSCKEV